MNSYHREPITESHLHSFEPDPKFRVFLEAAPDGIVIVGSDARILIVNSQTEKMFGYQREELIGQFVEILLPDKYKISHVAQRNSYINKPNTRPMGAGRALTGRKKDGTEFPVEISLSPMPSEKGTLITSIIRDITERRRAEEYLQESLREKEALLKEIHHRVKNNLQVTSSLLKLQSDFIVDPKAKELFIESQNRIQSMALVHEKLYGSKDLSRINFAEYLESLAHLLFRSFAVDPNKIHLVCTKSHLFMSIETAVPCGLIINELVSNCLKHAFPEGKEGTISVNIKKLENNNIMMSVTDNGIGLPDNFSFENTETLGIRLVQTLVKQIEGQIEFKSDHGATFTVIFPDISGGIK